MVTTDAIEQIKEKFLESGHSAEIPLYKGQKTFQAILTENALMLVI
ncbi:hypothetical protein [Neobacillus sp.]|nr:hypothetical protein [Neobacillus sp.]